MKRLNLGCGLDYKPGWVNADFNKEVKADIYTDFNKELPFKDSEFDIILLDNVLEHIKDIFLFIDELWRISKNGATISIYVPHFSGIYASKHLSHYHQFGIGSFDIYKPEDAFNGERYGKARFEILEQKLIYFHHKAIEVPFLSKIPINWIFNGGRISKLLWEKFSPLKFDEIFFKLKVVK